jgi:hypothetical protein
MERKTEKITKEMLADIQWIHSILKTMGATSYDKRIVAKQTGQAVDFAKGALWERDQINAMAGDLLGEIASADQWHKSWPHRAAAIRAYLTS